MLRDWRLRQFKSVASTQSFLLRPLTVFAGANSSGKSSVLQSILMIAQTLASKVTSRQLVLNGELLKLGTFDDVVADSATVRRIEIGFTIDSEIFSASERSSFRSYSRRYFPAYYTPHAPQQGYFSVDLTFGPSESDEGLSSPKVRTLQALMQEATFLARVDSSRPDSESPETLTLNLRRRSPAELEVLRNTYTLGMHGNPSYVDKRTLAYRADVTPQDAVSLRQRMPHSFGGPVDTVAASLDHFLPSWLVVGVNAALKQIYAILEELSRARQSEFLLDKLRQHPPPSIERAIASAIDSIAAVHGVSPQEVASAIGSRRRMTSADLGSDIDMQLLREVMTRLDESVKLQQVVEVADMPEPLGLLCAYVFETFGALRYLGPLRDDPKPVYGIASSADPSDVGVKGEYTAAVLDLYADQVIEYPSPRNMFGDPVRATFRQAVAEWLKHFEIAEDYSTKEEGKLGHTLLIRPMGVSKDLDLTNVGVGVSQVLPIVVMSLISDPGAILVFEQPELHLHPKVQSALGDFFLALVRMRRQCIIETHSEYLINRLRLRCAEASWDDPLHRRVMLYFVERSGTHSGFAPVEINEYGAIKDWPRGFFDQGPSEADRIVAAAHRKRQSRPRGS